MPSFGSHSMRGFTRFTDRVGEALGRVVIWSTEPDPVAPPLHIRPTAEPTLDGEPGDFYVTADGVLMGWDGDAYAPAGGGPSGGVIDVTRGPFNAWGDGEHDDTDAIQAAIDAVADAGGGEVFLPPGEYAIADALTVQQNVALVGAGVAVSRIKATHASACIIGPSMSYVTWREFAFDGNDLSTVGIEIGTVEGSNCGGMRNVRVFDCVGTNGALRLHNVQNGHFDNIEISSSTSGLWVDDGSGSLVFTALKCNNNEYWQVKIGSSGAEASGYTEPAGIIFIAPMLEWIGEAATANTVATVLVTGGERLMMIDPIIVAPDGGQTEPALAMATVAPNTICRMQIIGGALAGGTTDKLITLGATSYLTFTGQNFLAGAAVGVHLSAATAQLLGDMPVNGATTARSFAGGASENNNVFRFTANQAFYTGSSTADTVEKVTISGESGIRFVQYADGSMGWMNGTSYAPDTTVGRQGTALFGTPIYVSIQAGAGGWNSGHLTLGGYHLWVDATGDLRIKNGAPASDLEGAVVGTQS